MGFRTKDEKDIYVSWKRGLEDRKEKALKQVSDMLRHNVFSVESKKELQRIGEQLNEDFVNRITESLDNFRNKHGLVHNVTTDKEGMQLGGDEHPETVSSGRLKRYCGAL